MADQQTGVARRRIAVADVRLHYRVAGRGRGRAGAPVVCLPAPNDSSSSLTPLLAAFGDHRLAFALDLPGQGRSGNPPTGRRDPAWWLLRWLERLGFEHCHLVVFEGGIGVATDAVRRSARAVNSVALLNPPSATPPGALQRLGNGITGGLRELPLIARGGARLRGGAATAFREAMHPRDLDEEIAGLVLPLVVVRGEEDSLVSRTEAARLARRGRGTFIDLPAATRGLHRTHPEAIASTLERWWGQIEGHDGAIASHRDDAAPGR